MSYIVKNCPCIKHYDEIELDNRCMSDRYIHFFCENTTDCVIKQVIQECRKSIKCFESNEIVCPVCSDASSAELAQDILQLFDIEEINK